MPHRKAFDKVKVQLMMNPAVVFYTTILFSLQLEWTETISTGATDGKHLKINPVWFLSLTPEERIGLVLHEVLHVALCHPIRCGNRQPRRFNQAADYIVNGIAINAGFKLPQEALINSKYDKYNTEQVYNLLPEVDETEPNTGMQGDVIYTNETTQEPITAHITSTLLRAKNQAELCASGSLPDETLIELDKLVNPILPWEQLLQNYMQERMPVEYSWIRPNKRYAPEYYLPKLNAEALEHIALAVDTSGSVSISDFKQFISEIQKIQDTLNPSLLTLLDFDVTIKNIYKVERHERLMDLAFHGRGGTDIKEVVQWANKYKPRVLLIFTDGEFSPIAEQVKYSDVLWVIHNNRFFTAPYGKVIYYEI